MRSIAAICFTNFCNTCKLTKCFLCGYSHFSLSKPSCMLIIVILDVHSHFSLSKPSCMLIHNLNFRCAFINTPKYCQVKATGKGKIVSQKWVYDCLSKKKRLPEKRLEKRQKASVGFN